MKKYKVYLTGGDGIGWAVDEDLRLTRQAISNIVELVATPDEADVIHSLWWWKLLDLSPEILCTKRVICHVSGEPFRLMGVLDHAWMMDQVGTWVTRSTQAQSQMSQLGIPNRLIPYLVDTDTFRPLASDDESAIEMRRRWDIPIGNYLIGSFQRDTEGSDLASPKLVKGPDAFAEVVARLWQKGKNIHVVLAGPRRHWLMRRLNDLGIPFTYIGEPVEYDDIDLNTLSRQELNVLYNLVDLCLVVSRSEGGPHAVLEAAAARCKVVSAPVGIAPDLLEPTCLAESPSRAVEIIEADMDRGILASSSEAHYKKIRRNHVPDACRALFAQLYENLPESSGLPAVNRTSEAPQGHLRASKPRPLTVSLWHKFFKPPYGGGNQFMLALRKGLQKSGVDVRENELNDGIDAYVLNSVQFDVEAFRSLRTSRPLNIVHRIDGPIYLIRGFDREKDEFCFELNDTLASVTVIQSSWTFQRIVEMGYRPKSPVIIHNGVDPSIFHSRGRSPFRRGRKVRLISTSWSNNPRKGGPTYKWIEENLDWDMFEYTFVGNVSQPFDRVNHIPALPSEALADLLRQHDIYITASSNDPCSNALIEALACGLPALYLNDGGHPELVGYGGLPFSDTDHILPQLDRLVQDYEMFQNLICVQTIDTVAEKYLDLIRRVTQ
jgi:glycosyltransferase involved in cell wall biosynthesis